jgi:hypothetical protein
MRHAADGNRINTSVELHPRHKQYIIMSAVQPVVPTDADCLDLSALLAPLSRDDVELLLVRLLDKHREEANWIVQVIHNMQNTCALTPTQMGTEQVS